jgi:hypothetical protein
MSCWRIGRHSSRLVPDMPVECPRCLETNSDSSFTCSCGYDLTPLVRRRLVAERPRGAQEPPHSRSREMSHWHFFVGVGIVWLLLSLGEGFKLKLDLASRATSRLVGDSLMIGAADLAGALVGGALAWIAVWVMRSYEAIRYRPCPKRTTLATTIVSAMLIFAGRITPSGVIAQQIIQGLIIVSLMGAAYFAGSRRWLGKW